MDLPLNNIKTTQDCHEFVSDLRELYDFQFEVGKNKKMEKSTWVNDFFDLNKDKYGIIEIEKQIDLLPQVNMTLAIEPSVAILDEIINWLRTNVNKSAVVDIKIDYSILGGAIIEFKGKYEDLSVKKKVESILAVGSN